MTTTPAYHVKPTGTFRWADNSLFGDGTLSITMVRPWLYDGDFTALDHWDVDLTVTSGVITHPGGGDLYVWAPATYRFDLYDSTSELVQSWTGLLEKSGGTADSSYTVDLATVLNQLADPAPVAAYLGQVRGVFEMIGGFRDATSGQYPIPNSTLTIRCEDNIYDAANTSIILNGPTLGTNMTITTTDGIASIDAAAQIWLPASGSTATYGITIVDTADSTITYFDRTGLEMSLGGIAPAAACTASVIAGLGVCPAGTYKFKYTYVTAYGESLPSAASTPLVLIAPSRIGLTDVLVGPSDTIARNIYVSADGGLTYRRLRGITNNTATTLSVLNVTGEPIAPPTSAAISLNHVIPRAMSTYTSVTNGYHMKLTGTFRYSDYTLFGDGLLRITQVTPWPYEGDHVALDYWVVDLPVVAGVVTHPTAGDLYVWAPATYRFDLLDDAGEIAQTWTGLLARGSSDHDAAYTVDLATVLNTFLYPAPTAGYFHQVIGRMEKVGGTGAGAHNISKSKIFLSCDSFVYDAGNTDVIVFGEIPAGVGVIDTVGGLSQTTAAKILLPASYRVRIADYTDDTTYFDQSGISISRITASAPAAACSGATGAAGNVDVGSHLYRYGYVVAGGESPLSDASAAVTVAGSAAKVNLSDVLVGPTGTTARRIYRTKAGATTPYYYVGTIADNTTTTFEDDTADASVGIERDTLPAVDLSAIIPPFMV